MADISRMRRFQRLKFCQVYIGSVYICFGGNIVQIQIPSSNTKFGMRTFAYRASKLWNDLQNKLLDIKSLPYLNSKPQ